MSDDLEIDILPEEVPMGQSGENESLLILMDELKKSPSPLAQTVINEIKALQSRYILLRLDRDNWRKDYEYERSLSDKLFDCLDSFRTGTSNDEEESRKREVVLYEYGLKRRGLM